MFGRYPVASSAGFAGSNCHDSLYRNLGGFYAVCGWVEANPDAQQRDGARMR
jgi:hypothetical protein